MDIEAVDAGALAELEAAFVAMDDAQYDVLFAALATGADEWSTWTDLGALERERLIRPKEAARLLGIGKSTLYLFVKNGKVPKPTRISHKVAGWPMHVLIDWRDRQEGGPKAKRGKLAS